MYYLRTRGCFDSAHFLKNYDGKCRNIHGHRWRVVLEIMTKELHGADNEQLNGMHVDFTKLKADLKTEVDKMDHCFILQKGSLKDATMEALKEEEFRLMVVDFRPTAENLAKYFFDVMKTYGYEVYKVTVYETPKNGVSYTETF